MKKLAISCAAVLALAAMAGIARAQSDLGIRGAGLDLGLVDSSAGSTIGFGGLLELGHLSENVRLEANVDYWSKSYDVGAYLNSASYSISDLVVGATAKYDLGDEDASARWYLGGGLGMHFLGVGGDYGSGSESKIGVDILGGVRLNRSENMNFFGELRYRTVSNWTQTCVRAGVLFAFGE